MEPNLSTRTLLRTEETFERYRNNPRRKTDSCVLCEMVKAQPQGFLFWGVVPNEFPYDAIATDHLLLIPTRHFAEADDMTLMEQRELNDIRWWIEMELKCDAILENTPRGRTIPGHFHLHLLTWKRL